MKLEVCVGDGTNGLKLTATVETLPVAVPAPAPAATAAAFFRFVPFVAPATRAAGTVTGPNGVCTTRVAAMSVGGVLLPGGGRLVTVSGTRGAALVVVGVPV